MTKDITFITGNPGKAEQLSKYLGIEVKHHKVDLTEIQSLDLEEVIKHKVIEAFNEVKSPVIVDDVSLVIDQLGKLPGPLIKFFLSEIGNEGICEVVSYYEKKTALATVAIGYYDGIESQVFLGEIRGKISEIPKGEGGFGWDKIFIPDGFTQTRAEMNSEDYDKTNPRKTALDKLEKFLKSR